MGYHYCDPAAPTERSRGLTGAQAPGTGGGDHTEPRRILVVEDEPLIALELASIFESAGATVISPASSLTAARELLKNQTPDAALLDVNVAGERVENSPQRSCDRTRHLRF
jgi:CheY-like chemotaxis protein